MVKLTIRLPEKLKKELARLAKEQGCSQAQIVREILQEVLQRRNRPRPTVPLFEGGLGDPSASERVDELLEEGFGRS